MRKPLIFSIRNLVILAVILAGIAGSVGITRAAEPNGNSAAVQQIIKIQDEWNQALVAKNLSFIRRLYDDRIAYTNSQGIMLTKAQLIAFYQSGVLKFFKMSHNDIKVTVFGDTAILTGRSTSKMSYRGRVSYGPRRFTNVFVKRDGRWRLIAHQVTLIHKQN